MTKERIDFEIVPIFNQFANFGVWHDFAQIQIKAETVKYGWIHDNEDQNRLFHDHFNRWKNFKYNMAFAAYHENKMLGFATGYKEKGEHAYLQNLYVDPTYEGMGVGRGLLDKIERASNLVSYTIDLISLDGAVSFYEAHKYRNFDNRIMSKNLPQDLVGVIPMFEWFRKNLRATIDVEVDNHFLKHNDNSPIFVYVTPKRRIVAVGTRTKEGANVIWGSEKDGKEMCRFYKAQIVKALSKVR